VESLPPGFEPADAIRWAGDRVTELLAGLAELPLDRLVDVVPPAATTGEQAQDPSSTQSVPTGEPITVRAAPGTQVEVRIWVHPVGRVPVSTMRFVLTDLVGPTGPPLPGDSAEFVPAELTVPSPVGTSVLLRLAIPEQTTRGGHVGLVVGRGVTGATLPLTVLVG
jgi:hypothetical protein